MPVSEPTQMGAIPLSLRQQAQLLDSIGEALIATDVHGCIVYANQRAEELYGWRREDMAGRSILEVTVPVDAVPRAQAIMERLRAGHSWSGEFEVRRRDGSTFLAQVTNSPVFDEAQQLVAVIGVSLDITSQKRAQLRLERHVRLLHMLHQCSDAIIRAESEGALLHEICHIVHDTGTYACVQVAYARPGMPLLDLQAEAPPSCAAGEAAWRTALRLPQGPAARTLLTGETTVLQDIWEGDAWGALLLAAQRAGFRSLIALPLGMRGATHGVLLLHGTRAGLFVPEKVQFLEELAHDLSLAIANLRARDERRRTRRALEVIASGVTGHTGIAFHQALIAGLLAAMGAHSGFTARRLGAQRFRILAGATVGGPLPSAEFTLDERLCAEAIWLDRGHPLYDGIPCPLLHSQDISSLAMVPLIGNDGASIGVSMLAFDAAPVQPETAIAVLRMFAARAAAEMERDDADTRIREQAALLERLNTELEQRVRLRTAELEAANNELKAFSYSVSHDLRAPLAAVAGFAGALEHWCGAALQERCRHALTRIQEGTRRMEGLIQGLLLLAKVSQDEVRCELVDLSALATEVVLELSMAHPRTGVEVRIQPHLFGHGDARLLHQVLANLLGNAWKFTSRQERALIEFTAREDLDGRLRYQVRDNGPGFDMNYATRLFGDFQRLHRQGDFSGTGVGLATVRRIIERHRGKVHAHSASDGATFSFTLGNCAEQSDPAHGDEKYSPPTRTDGHLPLETPALAWQLVSPMHRPADADVP